MKKCEFDKKVNEYCKGKQIRFTDELVGVHEEKYQDYKYYFVYCNTNNVYQAFTSKKDVIDYINQK